MNRKKKRDKFIFLRFIFKYVFPYLLFFIATFAALRIPYKFYYNGVTFDILNFMVTAVPLFLIFNAIAVFASTYWLLFLKNNDLIR